MKIVLTKIWKWIDHNRWTVIMPVVATVLWVIAVGCTPEVQSPTQPGRMVNAAELQIEYDYMIAQFDEAASDLDRQAEAQAEFKQLILALASGSVAGWPGLLQMLFGGTLLGVAGDNIRKNGVIGGLKRNKNV